MTNCEDLRDLYELYALGCLEQEERVELDEHLSRECPSCVKGIRGALALNAMLESFVPEVEPPRHLRARVLASVGAPSAKARNRKNPRAFAFCR